MHYHTVLIIISAVTSNCYSFIYFPNLYVQNTFTTDSLMFQKPMYTQIRSFLSFFLFAVAFFKIRQHATTYPCLLSYPFSPFSPSSSSPWWWWWCSSPCSQWWPWCDSATAKSWSYTLNAFACKNDTPDNKQIANRIKHKWFLIVSKSRIIYPVNACTDLLRANLFFSLIDFKNRKLNIFWFNEIGWTNVSKVSTELVLIVW